MKRNNKIILIIILISLIFIKNNVYAAPCPSAGSGASIQGSASGSGSSATISVNGASYDAYCVDPGANNLKGTVVCGEANGGYEQLAETLAGLNNGDKYDLMTFRIFTNISEIDKRQDTEKNKEELLFAINMGEYVQTNDSQALQNARDIAARNPSIFTSPDEAVDAYYVAASAISGILTRTSASNEEVKVSFLDMKTLSDYKVKLLASSGRAGVFECYSSNSSNKQSWIFVCDDEEEEECVDANGDGMDDLTGALCSEECVDANGDGMDDLTGATCEEEEDGDESCCSPAVDSKYRNGNVHNCCYEDTESQVQEYYLDDLFCKDKKGLGVEHYLPKCGADYYMDQNMTGQLPTEFCQIYCTERVFVNYPGAITATSGRYFDLNKISSPLGEITSPYVEGNKRCRERIDYDLWHKQYLAAVKNEMNAYNDYQFNQASYLSYTEAIGNKREINQHINITCKWVVVNTPKCHWQEPCLNGIPGCLMEKEDDATFNLPSNPAPYNADWRYMEYWDFKNDKYKYHVVKIDDTKEKEPTTHESIELIFDATKTNGYSMKHWGSGEGDDPHEMAPYTGAKQYYENNNGQTMTGAANCVQGTPDGEAEFELQCNEVPNANPTQDVYAKQKGYKSGAESAQSSYTSATSTAKNLEKQIDICDYFFSKYGGSSSGNYQFNPVLSGFEYTQIYLNEYGSLDKDVQTIPFEGGCEVTGPFCVGLAGCAEAPAGDEDHLRAPEYSTQKYMSGEEIMHDFMEATLKWEESPSGYKGYYHEPYNADKKFTQDAKYTAKCAWHEPSNTAYTLIPRGTNTSTTKNWTANENQYHALLTTLEGTYDTYWMLSGLGEGGKFDPDFASAPTCSSNGGGEGILHCGLKIEHEIVWTGKCNGTYVTVNPDECEPEKAPETVLNFKIVDPEHLFPSCNSFEDCGYAYNWYKGNNGPETLENIQIVGGRDETYAPANVTYVFTLNPQDLREIKNYNSAAESNGQGGYSDFNLTCNVDCQTTEGCNEIYAGNNTCKRISSCKQCTSTFIQNFKNGIITYRGSTHSVTAATGDGAIHWAS